MTPVLVFTGWTAAGIVLWLRAYPVDPAGAAAAIRETLRPAFDAGAWLDGWGEAITTWMLLAGVLSLAARAGGELRHWTRTRAGAGDGTVLRIALGLGLGGTAIFGAGLAGLLFAPPAWAVFAVLGTAGGAGLGTWAFGRKHTRARREADAATAPDRVTRAAIALAALVAGAGVFGPETGWDAMMYHLRLPDFWQARHKIRDIPHDFYSTYPQLAESLYAGCRLAGGDALARWLEAACAPLLALAAGDLARRLGGPARFATAVVAASPLVLALVPRAYVDLHLAVFGSLAMALAARGAFLPAAILAGFGLGTKYVGVFVFPALAAIVLAGRARRAPVLRAAVALAVTAGPWYLRTFLARGNPVEPYLAGWFGTGADLPATVVPFFERADGLRLLLADLPRRAAALLLDPGYLQSPLSPAVFLWVPLWWAPGAARDGYARRLRAGTLGWLAGWWLLAPDARFALAAVPAAAALALSGLARWRPAGAWPARLLRVTVATPLVAGALYATTHELATLDPLSIPLGRGTSSSRLSRGLTPAPFAHLAARAVQARVPADGRVLVTSHFITYHTGRECLADWHAGRSRLVRLIAGARDPEDIRRAFRRAGVGWQLFTGPGCEGYLDTPGYYDAPVAAWAAYGRFLATRSRVAWQTEGYALLSFELRAGAARAPGPVPYLPGRETAAFAAADRSLKEGSPAGVAAALAAYDRAPPELAETGSTWRRRGEARLALGRNAQAAADLDRALAAGVDTPGLRERRAFARWALGRPDAALADIEEAARQLPGHPGIEQTRRAIAAAVSRPTTR